LSRRTTDGARVAATSLTPRVRRHRLGTSRAAAHRPCSAGAVARALIGHPEILLLDEPFSALDAFTRASLHEMLLSLWQELRPTILIVTHDVEEAVILADRIVVMRPRPGRVYETMTLRLPRPRNKLTSEYDMARRDVLRTIDRSLASERSTGLWSGAVSPWV
jgi:ABC-type multidrug transport system ATPase subunit